MKAFKKRFEKWWNNMCILGDAEALRKIKPRYQIGFCGGYRAALEQVLLLNSVRIHDDVYEDIKEELEGEG